jgi:hypothetical protein
MASVISPFGPHFPTGTSLSARILIRYGTEQAVWVPGSSERKNSDHNCFGPDHVAFIVELLTVKITEVEKT